jgi:glycosyltransferase involved in cell wall biosynthesis
VSAPGPRVVIGLTAFNGARHLAEALESFLAQTFTDFALLVADDGSADETPAIAARYVQQDARVALLRSDERLGMIRNWQRAYDEARARHSQAEYFAWASDHDVWHPSWLESLVGVLDAEPDVVLAYPLDVGVADDGARIRDSWSFDTFGCTDLHERADRVIRGMSAGNMIYGLVRAQLPERCGVFRPVLLPDKLFLFELALLGQFKQVPRLLWYRRYPADVTPSLARQRAALFGGEAPWYTHLRWWAPHSWFLLRSLLRRESGPDGLGRIAALRLVASYYLLNFRIERAKQLVLVRRRLRSWREAIPTRRLTRPRDR